MYYLGQAVHFFLWSFLLLLWGRFVADWVQVFARSWSPRGPVLVALEVIYSITDPPIKALRRVIPPLRIGGFALDLSFLIVLLVVYVALQLTVAVFPI